jgi:hypothetical protein
MYSVFPLRREKMVSISTGIWFWLTGRTPFRRPGLGFEVDKGLLRKHGKPLLSKNGF